jgi:radical S-adenosyl methionine domain-containing protein 2
MKIIAAATTMLPLLASAYTTNNKNTPPPSLSVANRVKSVNYFISRECNYKCKFCFHTQKNTHKLGIGHAKLGLSLLQHSGTEKINFAGGEPFLNPELLGELSRYAHEECGMAVSIISNGSLIKPDWMDRFGRYVDILGVSVDSFDPATNALIGRGSGDTTRNQHATRVLKVREMCAQHGILFKMNTVVCSLNHREDMNEYVEKLDPYRWKAFQCLILKGENAGGEGDINDARHLQVTPDEFDAFIQRHSEQEALIPEPNTVMQNSYLLLDEELRFLDCSENGKIPSQSILEVGVERALSQAGFDDAMFQKRGGIFEWTRDRGDTGR